MHWRLILEEFGPELKYIKGENNVVSDALYFLGMSENQDILNISELYGYNENDLPDSSYPICYHYIAKSQKTDAKLQQNIVSHKDYTLDTFRGGDQNHHLIFQNSKICLPTALQKKLLDWYHKMLCNQKRIAQSILSVYISTGKAFTQQSITCRRSAQRAKEPKQLIRNMAICHPNRLKPIPGTRYM